MDLLKKLLKKGLVIKDKRYLPIDDLITNLKKYIMQYKSFPVIFEIKKQGDNTAYIAIKYIEQYKIDALYLSKKLNSHILLLFETFSLNRRCEVILELLIGVESEKLNKIYE